MQLFYNPQRLIAILVLAFFIPAISSAEALYAEDFGQIGVLSKQKNIPILVVFNGEHCEYCQRLAAEQINPMLISGEYDDKVIIRQISVDAYDSIQDFSGENVAVSDFVSRYEVSVTPTVMLLDYTGRILTRKLIGYQNGDFYSFYLDDAITTANKKLRHALAP